MKKTLQLLVVSGALVVTSCVPTLNSIFTAKDVTYDPALNGAWQNAEATWTLMPLVARGGRYSLRTEMKEQPPAEWYATLGAIGTNRFLELLPRRPDAIHQKSFYGGHFIELRSFWKVALDGDTLTLTPMSSQWLEAMLKQNKVSIRYEKPDGGMLFLTASTPELQAFVGKYADDPGAFPLGGDEKGVRFMRAKAIGPALGLSAPGVTAPTGDGASKMSLSLPNATDENLAALKDRQDLRELVLVHSRVTDAGLVHLKALQRLQSLDLSFAQVTDAGLAHLKEMKGLRALNLRETKVTDAGLASLGDMRGLRALYLEVPQMTDAGLVHLKQLKALQTLDLKGSQVTDAGLAHLKEMKGLQSLDLSYTRVTDAGLAELKDMTGLRTLDLARTRVTEAGFVYLKDLAGLQTLSLHGSEVAGGAGLVNLQEMKGLQTLDLGDTKRRTPPDPLVYLTDAALVQIKELKALQTLDVSFAKVTDAGLAELREMKSLRRLNLACTQVTDAGLANLKAALPNTDIVK